MSTTSNVLTASPISFKQLWDSAPTVRMVPLPTDDVRRYPFTFYFTLSIVRGDNVPEMLPAFLGDVIAHLDGPKQTVTFSVQDRVACRRISLVHPSRLDGVNKSVLPMIKDRHDETWYLTLTPQGGLSWVHDRETSKGLFTQSMRRDRNDNQAMYRRALELCMTAYPDPDHTATLVYPPKPFGEPNVQDDAASAGPSRSRRTLIPSAKAQQKEQVIKRKAISRGRVQKKAYRRQEEPDDDNDNGSDEESTKNRANRLQCTVGVPENVEHVTWPHLGGIKTVLPFAETKGIDKNAVKVLAQAQAAGDESVVFMSYPHQSGTMEHAQRIVQDVRDVLRSNRSVVLRGWHPENRILFDLADIAYLHPDIEQRVDAQDAMLRDQARTSKETIHLRCTIQHVVETASDPDVCLNVLDLPIYRGETPHVMRSIADDTLSMQITSKDGYMLAKGHQVDSKTVDTFSGPQVLPVDMLNVRSWDILTHGGFLTYPHRDGTGMGTYSYVRTGAKIWVYLRPDIDDLHLRSEAYKALDGAFDATEPNLKDYVGTMRAVLLEEGDLLIQPPGLTHAVYTPTHSLISGGHFVCYDTLHIMEFALAYNVSMLQNVERRLISTNAEHWSVQRVLSRMVLALPVLGQSPHRKSFRVFYRRPLLAIIHMFVMEAEYAFVTKGTDHPKYRSRDTYSVEEQNELQVVENVISALMTIMNVTDDSVYEAMMMRPNDGWFDAGPTVDLTGLKKILDELEKNPGCVPVRLS